MAAVTAPVLVPAGAHVSRNYPANPYPFRASSHFLYLVGEGIPGAQLLLHDGEATLYLPPEGPDDALWHGEAPAFEHLGLPIRRTDTLAPPPGTLAVAGPDSATRASQATLLGRPVERTDHELAEALVELRLVHDAAAIAELRDAAEATVAAHIVGMRATRPGLREWAIKADMEAALASRGMTTAYGSIVSVHGEVLHNDAHHNVLNDGDLLLADVGAETRGGWAGDVTRTWPVSGRFSESQRVVYDMVRMAQEAAIEKVAPGVRYRDVHLAACRVIAGCLVDLGVLRGDPDGLVEDDVHALFFPHGIGHLLGLDVHDMEDLGDLAGYAPGRTRSERFGLGYLRLDRDLQPGMAVTIEPGFYQVPAILEARGHLAGDRLNRERLAWFSDVRGIRIEDDVLVTERGCEVLTAAAPKDATAVEEQVGQR